MSGIAWKTILWLGIMGVAFYGGTLYSQEPPSLKNPKTRIEHPPQKRGPTQPPPRKPFQKGPPVGTSLRKLELAPLGPPEGKRPGPPRGKRPTGHAGPPSAEGLPLLPGIPRVVAPMKQKGLLPSIRFSHLNIDHGLPQNEVLTVFQDSRGFIWIGTDGGLSRFDGYHIVSYQQSTDNPNGIGPFEVNDIYEDQNGDLWIATGGGVSYFQPHTETFTHYPDASGEKDRAGKKRVYVIFSDS